MGGACPARFPLGVVGILRQTSMMSSNPEPIFSWAEYVTDPLEDRLAMLSRRLGEGDGFGELALLDVGATRTARIRVVKHVRCLAIARADFDRLLESEPSMAISMLRTLARRLAAKR